MSSSQELKQMVSAIGEDLTSGAAELALRAINIYRALLESPGEKSPAQLRSQLAEVSEMLIQAQPAMAPLFNLANEILHASDGAESSEELASSCLKASDQFETRLCESAAKIAETTSKLVPWGQTVFAYSFSSTVVSSLLNAKSQQKPFRVVCTESRPSLEGRKLAAMLASAGVDVTCSFDSSMGLYLPSCRVAFMGVDAVARPGIVNKVGSWLLALACRELQIPIFALAGTEKFVSDDLLFSFEDHERPGAEIWSDPPAGVRVVNRQFELIPFNWIAGLVTEEGILRSEEDAARFVDKIELHPELESRILSKL